MSNNKKTAISNKGHKWLTPQKELLMRRIIYIYNTVNSQVMHINNEAMFQSSETDDRFFKYGNEYSGEFIHVTINLGTIRVSWLELLFSDYFEYLPSTYCEYYITSDGNVDTNLWDTSGDDCPWFDVMEAWVEHMETVINDPLYIEKLMRKLDNIYEV